MTSRTRATHRDKHPSAASPVTEPAWRRVAHQAHLTNGTPLHVAGPGDESAVLSVLDASVRWLVDRGNLAQWGSEPFSTSPRRAAQASRWVKDALTLLVGDPAEPLAVITLGEAPAYVTPDQEPEIYLELLATSHQPQSTGLGRQLIHHAQQLTRSAGVNLLRVDCFAGADGRLLRFYEECGFTIQTRFNVDRWPGAILTWHRDHHSKRALDSCTR